MTIHRAKGLEFGVVCVADLGREPAGNGRRYLRLDAEGRVGVRLPPEPGGRAEAFAWKEIDDRERAEEAEEERRLLYVACTRAERRLLLSGALDVAKWREGRQCREPLGWLATAFEAELRLRLSSDGPRLRTALVDASLNAPETIGTVLREEALAPELPARRAGEEDGEAPASPRGGVGPGPTPAVSAESAGAPPPPAPAAAAPAVDQLSYSALEAYARCGYRFYVERVLGLPPSPLPGTSGQSAGLAAADRGTLAHGLLERLDLDGPAPGAADAHALAAAHGLELSADEAAGLAGLADRFARSRLAARLRAVSDVRREARFAFVLEPAGVLVAGAMDVLAREGGQALVIDYKSDRLEGRDPAAVVEAEYATQRAVYALAALRAAAERVEVAHCFLERPDEPAEARFGTADVPALEARLGALAEGALGGSFEVAPNPHAGLCLGCPARTTLCSWPEEMTLGPAPAA